MEIEYKKDLRHSYMVITKEDTLSPELYSVKMLEHQSIDGILPFEQRQLDNKVYYYYEITAKQSMINIFDKTALPYETLKQLFSCILEILEKAYEYLLPEDDFAVSPEFIYLDIITNSPNLSYVPGYAKNIKKQVNSLLEFLMNKVDYNDKAAVLLVYQLYAVSREEEFTFNQLLEVLQRNSGENPNQKSLKKIVMSPEIVEQPVQNNLDIPMMKEKIESEVELVCYSMQTLILSGICIVVGILIMIFSLSTGIIYNSFGNRIDISKLFALLLIVLCLEGYVQKKLLDKKNKISKIIKTCEYVDPRKDFTLKSLGIQIGQSNQTVQTNKTNQTTQAYKTNKTNQTDQTNQIDQTDKVKYIKPVKHEIQEKPEKSEKNDKSDTNDKNGKHEYNLILKRLTKEFLEEDDNPTCLLNSSSDHNSLLILKALDEINYKDITISSFPFFIGKLKKNVDYCLEKDVVSRFHAKIINEGEKYFLIDLNSMNGTFVNSEALMIYQKKEIKIGDEITFANIKYRFTNE